MDKSLFISMSGASEVMKSQAMHANNLANTSTIAFKMDLPELHSMPVYGSVYPSRVFVGSERIGTDVTPGAVIQTGNDLDIAINGEGWLSVQGEDGQEYYTRRGDMAISQSGYLMNGSEHLMLGDGGPISIPPAQKISIGQDGSINITPIGAAPGTSVTLGRLKLVSLPKEELTKNEQGLFMLKSRVPAPLDPAVQIKTGMLEASNVNPVADLIGLISSARQYELNVKMMENAKENDEAAARIMQPT